MKDKKIKNLSNTAVSLPRSGIRVLMEMASKMNDVIHLEIGEPSFPTPGYIIDAACSAARKGFTRYTPNAGFLSLREAISEKMKLVNGVNVSPDCVTVTVGGIGGLYSSLMALLEPNDEVLVPDPGWPNYISMVKACGARVVKYSLDPKRDFIPDITEIEESITDRTKVLIVNSPSNPCGTVFTRDVVNLLVNIAQRYGIYILSDEVYDQIVFKEKHNTFTSVEENSNIITVYSFSKTYSMTGWRVGYVIASQYISSIISKLQETFVSCASAISQKAAEAALLGEQNFVSESIKVYRTRSERVVELLSKAGLLINIPQGAFYILADISRTHMDSNSFALRLLKESRVAVAPGETFGDNAANSVRISLATKEKDLYEGVKRIGDFCIKSNKD